MTAQVDNYSASLAKVRLSKQDHYSASLALSHI
jgi:hypothetical protein